MLKVIKWHYSDVHHLHTCKRTSTSHANERAREVEGCEYFIHVKFDIWVSSFIDSVVDDDDDDAKSSFPCYIVTL